MSYIMHTRGDMILWTIQRVEAWRTLEQRGVLLGDTRRVNGYYR